MLPKPWQTGQAPNGLLNENSRGCGTSYGMLHSRHSNRSLNRCTIGAAVRRQPAARWRTPRRRLRRTPSRSSRSVARGDRLRSSGDRRSPAGSADPSASRDRRPRARRSARRRTAGRSPCAAAPRASRRPGRRDREGPAAATATRPRLRPMPAPPRRRPARRRQRRRRDHRHVEADEEPRAFRKLAETARHDLGRLANHLAAAVPAIRPADARIQQAQVVVDLGGRARPSTGDCGCCSSGGSRSPGQMPSIESMSGFSIRSRNCRA